MQDLSRRRLVLSRVALALGLAGAMAAPTLCQANPQGAQVVHGAASFAMPDAATLNVTNTPGAIINWQQFGIAPGEVTRFLQQSALSAVLNRVVGGDPSAILGSLLSNGQVFLINPNGVVFGPNAVVDTAGLLVSTLNMADEDFLAGRLRFAGDGSEGALVNQGSLHGSGGVVLIAPRVENSGLVESDGGGLLLAAGREVTITSLENPEISYQLRAPEHEAVNLGRLVTNGGPASVFAGSIRHSGEIDAGGVAVGTDGTVRLVASADITLEAGSRIAADGVGGGGNVHVESEGGTLIADGAAVSATGADGRGGEVRLLGERVGLTGSTRVDVSGAQGGGTVLVGGAFQGGDAAVRNARFTFAGTGTRIDADATRSGDGGTVILWADDTTRAHGAISATGGPGGGDGGFVEISGKRGLVFEAQVDTRAVDGASGTLLLDPDTINIIDSTPPVTPGSNDGNLPIFDATGANATTISEQALEAQTTNVLMIAPDGIVLEDLADNQLNMASLTGGESFTLRTVNGDISFQDVNDEIRVAGAVINLEATGAGNLTSVGNLTSIAGTGGNINLLATGGNVDLRGLVQSTGTTRGDVDIQAGGNVAALSGSGAISARNLKVAAGTGINMLVPGNNVAQFTASNTISGTIEFTNTGGLLTVAPNGTAFAVSNTATNGFINIAGIGGGGALTTTGLVEAPNGTTNQLQLQTSGLLTIGAGVSTPGTVFFLAEDQTISAPVSGNVIEVNGFNTGNLALGAANTLANGTLELSQADIDQLGGVNALSLGNGLTQNITVAGPITVTNASPTIRLTSLGQGIDVNASLNLGTRNLLLNASGAGSGDGDIRQNGAGVITASVVTVNADQAVQLSATTNQIGGFTVTSNALLNSGVQLDNNSGGVALALNNINSANANIDVSNAGGTSITGTVNGGTGNVTILESTLGINGGGGTVAGNTVTLDAPNTVNGGVGNGTQVKTDAGAGGLVVNSQGAGGAGNVDVEEANAIATSAVNITTNPGTPQDVKFTTASGAITIDGNLGNTQDNLTLSALANSINKPAGATPVLSANNLALLADAGIGSPAANQSVLSAATSITAASTSGGAIAIDNTGAVNILGLSTPGGGIIAFNQQGGTGAVTISGVVDAGSAGPISITSSSPLNVNANVVGVSTINLSSTGGAPNDLTIAPGVLVQASGVGSSVNLNAAGSLIQDGTVSSVQADVIAVAGNGVSIGATGSTTAAGLVDYSAGPTFVQNGVLQSNTGNVQVNSSVSLTMGANAVSRALLGVVDLNTTGTLTLGRLEAPTNQVSFESMRVNTSGAIVDGNGAAPNLVGHSFFLNAISGVGTIADPIESQVVDIFSLNTSGGDIAVANTGVLNNPTDNVISTTTGSLLLTSTGGLNFGAGGSLAGANGLTLGSSAGSASFSLMSLSASAGVATLTGATGLSLVNSGLTAGAGIALGAGTGLLLVDASSVNAGSGGLNAAGADVDFYSANISAADLQVVATNQLHLAAGLGSPVNVNIGNDVSITAGELLVEGGAVSGDSAKLNAGGGITINAGNVTVRGGAGGGSSAAIDPTSLVINAAGDVLVQAGTGAGSGAAMVADTVAITAGGSLSVIGAVNAAIIESLVGNISIQTGGPITLTAGADPSGDAVIVAAGGAGAVDVITPGASGVGLVLLGGDPFAPPFDTTAEAGVFAASLNVTAPPGAGGAGGDGGDGETNELNADEVLVLLDIFDQLSAENGSGDDDDEKDYRRLCR